MGEFGILDRVLTDAENAIYDAGMAAAYARAADVALAEGMAASSQMNERAIGAAKAASNILNAIKALSK